MTIKARGTGGSIKLLGSGGLIKFGVPEIVTSGLIAHLDASNPTSYPGSGTTIYDLTAQNADGTMEGSVTWVSDGQASYWNFPTGGDSTSDQISSTVAQNYVDFTIVMKPDFSLGPTIAYHVGLLAPDTGSGFSGNSLRFKGADGVGPWYWENPGNANDWMSSAGTIYNNGSSSSGNITFSSGWNILGGAKTNTGGLFGSPWPYYIGSAAYNRWMLKGKVAVVLLYNRELSQAEQRQNFNALKGRFGLGLT
jgi:hypothetical protein